MKNLTSKTPKPKVPNLYKPLGGGTGEPDPPMTPKNSQKGVKQQVKLNLPGVKLR